MQTSTVGLTGYVKALDPSATQKQKGIGHDEADREKLKSAAQEFEALFLSQMLGAMRATIAESGEKGFGQSTYTEMFDQEVARSLSQRGALGIADLLIRNLEIRAATAAAAAAEGSDKAGAAGESRQ